MADLTAHFVADFSNFKTAVDSATTKLKSFQTDANKVQASLGRIGDSFSGRKILQEATLAAKAVNDIGGVTKLTANEQARLNTLVTEAIAKYTALGQQVPADLQKIQEQTTKIADTSVQAAKGASSIQTGFKDLIAAAGPLGGIIAGAFSVERILSFTEAVFHAAADLGNLSAQTGVSTDDLQALDYAAAGSGVSIEVLANALSAMEKRLAEGNDSTVAATERLNLNLSDLQKLNAHEAFIRIAEAAKTAQDPIVALSDLFGERLARQILKLSDQDLPALEKAARDSGAVLDKELVQRAGQFEQAWQRAVLGVKATFADLLLSLPTVPGVTPRGGVPIDSGQAELLRRAQEANRQAQQLAQNLKPLYEGSQVLLGNVVQGEDIAAQIAQFVEEAAKESEKELEAQIKVSEEMRKQVAFGESWARFQSLNIRQTGDLVSLLERGRAALLPTGGTGVAGGPGTPLLPGGEVNKELTAALIQAVPEVKGLAKKTSSAFSDELLDNLGALRHRVPGIITDAFTGGGGLSGALKGIGVQLANAFLEPFIDTIISGLAKGQLKRAFVNAASGVAGGTALGAGGSYVAGEVSSTAAAASGAGGAGGLGFLSNPAFYTNPYTIGVTAAVVGGYLLYRHFAGQGKAANDIRDQFQSQFGHSGTGGGSGFRRLADTLHRIDDDALFSQLQSANNPGKVRQSEALIIADLSRHNLNKGIKSFQDGGFVPPGVVQPAILHGGRFGERVISGNRQTQGPALNQTSVVINVNAVDAAGFDRVWKDRIVPQLKLELLTNQLGTVTAINRVVAKA